MTTFHDKALDNLANAATCDLKNATYLERRNTYTLTAIAYALLNLSDVQTEATEWGKAQVLKMAEQQTQFLADLKASLDD